MKSTTESKTVRTRKYTLTFKDLLNLLVSEGEITPEDGRQATGHGSAEIEITEQLPETITGEPATCIKLYRWKDAPPIAKAAKPNTPPESWVAVAPSGVKPPWNYVDHMELEDCTIYFGVAL